MQCCGVAYMYLEVVSSLDSEDDAAAWGSRESWGFNITMTELFYLEKCLKYT